MSAVIPVADAQRLTMRIKLLAGNVRENLEKLRDRVDEAKRTEAWSVLGFRSWTEYLSDTLGSEPMRLGRTERRELVEYLSGEGMSTRAIAPIVGVSKSQVAADIEVSSSGHLPSAPVTPTVEVTDPIANPLTGEVIEPTIVEHTETVKTKTVTGLDGKVYAQQTALHAAESSPEVQAAKYVLAFSKAMTRSDDFLEFDPERIGRLSAESIESVEGLLKSTEHFLAHMRPGLRIVGGDR